MTISGIPGAGASGRGDAVRVMVCMIDGCRVAIPLDAIVETLDRASFDARARQDRSYSVPLVDWSDLIGMASDELVRSQVVVVRTGRDAAGLGVDACLGVRELSLRATSPVATHLCDAQGEPLCFLLRGDGELHLLLDPRAVARAPRAAAQGGAEPRPADPHGH